jgi:hypothetical protein
VYTFEADEENSLPAGFASGMTGQWKATEWKVQEVFPICWVKDARAKDLAVGVRLCPLRPPPGIKKAIPDGAGIVARFKDPDKY